MRIPNDNLTPNEELVKQFVKLHILYMRYYKRHTAKKCSTYEDLEMLLTHNQPYMTYSEAVKRLKKDIFKLCENKKYFISNVTELENKIQDSEIANLRFGIKPKKKFSEEEYKLDNYRFRALLYYISTLGLKDASIMANVSISALKQACQDERLLNTEKINHSWRVHLGEVRKYWNIKDTNYEHLYYDWEY